MKCRLLLSLFLLLIGIQGNSQSVGVVLSGGGAKGMAHIAVLRVLEENNIPIDYISGTSIGAIVGGLYAAGYTPDEMEELFKSDDFYFWSTGKIQTGYRYYFKQPEADPTWLQLRITRKNEKVKLLPPTNIIPAEQMDFAFMELTAATSAACDYDFNHLMVPFFCVAADVYNSKPVVLRNGDLGNAIRASMTVPLYFKPIEINGSLLFDGGLLNNFPTQQMKEIFKPDIIIGHKVANNVRAAEADDLMQQISNLVMRPTNFEIDPKDGILLETRFEDVGLLDFDKIDQAMEAGGKTAMNALDSIKALVTRRVAKDEIQEKRNNFVARKPALYFQNIQVEGVQDNMQRQFIIQSMKHGMPIVSLADLKKEYFKLVSDQQVKSIQPITYYNKETGYFDLHLKVEPEKKVDVNIGGNISTKPINQGYVGVNYRMYNRRAYLLNSNLFFGRFYSSFKLGGRIDYPSRLPYYLASYFTLNRWDYFASSSELFFENVRPPYIIRDELSFRVETGFPLGLNSKFYTGVAYSSASDQYYQTEIFNKEDEPDESTFNAFVADVRLETNSLNYKQYATEGLLRMLDIKYVVGEEGHLPGSTSEVRGRILQHQEYFQVNAKLLRYFNFGKAFTLGVHAEGMLGTKDLFRNYKAVKLSAPGFQPTPHSKSLFLNNFHSNQFTAGGLKTIFNFTPDIHLRLESYAFLPIREELIKEDLTAYRSDNLFHNIYWQGMAAMVYQTGIGPISLAVNYYEKENTQWYVTLNFGYILFNKRGL